MLIFCLLCKSSSLNLYLFMYMEHIVNVKCINQIRFRKVNLLVKLDKSFWYLFEYLKRNHCMSGLLLHRGLIKVFRYSFFGTIPFWDLQISRWSDKIKTVYEPISKVRYGPKKTVSKHLKLREKNFIRSCVPCPAIDLNWTPKRTVSCTRNV